MKVLCMGNALTDLIIQLDNDQQLENLSLPKASMQLIGADRAKQILDTFKDKKKDICAGGSASNTAYGIASLGGKVGFIGMIGTDETGNAFKQDQLNSGITPQLFLSDHPSGTAITLMSKDSERTFATFLGAALGMEAEMLTDSMFEGYGLLHIEGYLVQNYDLIRTAITMAKKHGLLVSLDLASYNIVEESRDFLMEMIENHVDILFANEEEAKALTGQEPEEAIEFMSGKCPYSIVKIGSKGSLIKHNGHLHRIDAIPAECLDTNGAGDGYAAGFLYGLTQKMDIQKCGMLASLVAGNVVQTVGPRIQAERWGEIRKFAQN